MPPHPSEAIGGGACGCPPAPQALEGLEARLGLVFPEAPGGPQPGVDVSHGRAPEGAAGFGFLIVFFEPLFCT